MGMITIYNKGKRVWNPKQVQGLEVVLEPQGSAEMEEALGRRFAMNYPRDISTNGIPVVSTSEIARREQSVNDREENLKKWEASLKEREAKIAEREKELESISLVRGLKDASELEKPKRVRPAKEAEEVAE